MLTSRYGLYAGVKIVSARGLLASEGTVHTLAPSNISHDKDKLIPDRGLPNIYLYSSQWQQHIPLLNLFKLNEWVSVSYLGR